MRPKRTRSGLDGRYFFVMKSRTEAAKFAAAQLHWSYEVPRDKPYCHHYGLQDLRVLLDFIYGGPPANADEELWPEDKVIKRP